MPKTLLKDTFRLIKRTRVRFLAVFAIVCLGVAFFVGVTGSSNVMGTSVDTYNDAYHLHDVIIYSSYGFDEDDIQALSSQDNVLLAEGSCFTDVTAVCGSTSLITRIHSYSDTQVIDRFELTEGRMPENENEALAEEAAGVAEYFSIGDIVDLYEADEENRILKSSQVTIVGTIRTPLYLNITKENSQLSNREIDTYLYVREEMFDTDCFLSAAVITSEGESCNSFQQDYRDYIEPVTEQLKQFAEKQQYVRWQKLKDAAEEEYENGLQSYEDGLKEFYENLAAGEKELSDGEKEIVEGLQQIEDAETELAEAQNTLNNEIETAGNRLKNAEDEIRKGYSEIAIQQKELDDAKAQLQETAALLPEIQTGIDQIDEALKSLQEAQDAVEMIDENLESLQSAATLYEELSSLLEAVPEDMTLRDLSGIYPELGESAATFHLSETDTVYDWKQLLPAAVQSTEETRVQLEEQKQEILDAAGMDDLQAGIQLLTEQKELLKKQKTEIEDGLNSLEEGQSQIDAAETQLDKSMQDISDAYVQLEEQRSNGQKQIDDGYAQIADNRVKIAEAQSELNHAKEELHTAKAEGEQELADASAELEDARKQIDEMEEPVWTVLDRTSHYSSATYQASIDQMAAIGNLFPVFFLLVAALVCLTTMTRMIDEQRGQIGILRALGYTPMQCTAEYLIYAGLASAGGIIAGIVIGMLTFPVIIYQTWKLRYVLPDMIVQIPWTLVIGSSAAFLGAMLCTTYFTCNKDTREVPAQLMRPKSPKLGQKLILEKIPFFWHKLTFTWKVTIRNLFRYRRRFIMTVLGVAGCTALIVTGFGINDSISYMVNEQYDHIIQYDGKIYQEDDLTDMQRTQIEKSILNVEGISAVYSGFSYSSIVHGAIDETVNVEIAVEAKDMEQLYDLHEMSGGKALVPDDEGVIITQKMSENLNLSVGDTIMMEDEDGNQGLLVISGIAEMYIYHNVFMTENYYQKVFGRSPQSHVFYVSCMDVSDETVQEEIADMDGISSISFLDNEYASFKNMADSLGMIVAAIIVSSMLLAFIVLGNLINVNISERQREIATLKVLGFRKREVQSYIYKENNILAVIGALCGLPLGTLLHHWILRTVEMDNMMFGRSIDFTSYLFAFALTLIFSVLVDLFMADKLHKIQMVESLKSVE